MSKRDFNGGCPVFSYCCVCMFYKMFILTCVFFLSENSNSQQRSSSQSLSRQNSSQSSLQRSSSTASDRGDEDMSEDSNSRPETESKSSPVPSSPVATPKQTTFPSKASDTTDAVRLKCRELLANALRTERRFSEELLMLVNNSFCLVIV